MLGKDGDGVFGERRQIHGLPVAADARRVVFVENTLNVDERHGCRHLSQGFAVVSQGSCHGFAVFGISRVDRGEHHRASAVQLLREVRYRRHLRVHIQGRDLMTVPRSGSTSTDFMRCKSTAMPPSAVA